jgi:hypothetical protein
VIGKPLISLVPARSRLQHRIDRKNEADTARNPYFIGLSVGALGEIRTPDPRIRSPRISSFGPFHRVTVVVEKCPVLIYKSANVVPC